MNKRTLGVLIFLVSLPALALANTLVPGPLIYIAAQSTKLAALWFVSAMAVCIGAEWLIYRIFRFPRPLALSAIANIVSLILGVPLTFFSLAVVPVDPFLTPTALSIIAEGAVIIGLLRHPWFRSSRPTGITRTLVMVVMANIFSSILLLCLVWFFPPRPPWQGSERSICINNLRLIDHAKEALAITNNWTNGYVIADTPEAIWATLDPYIDGTNVLRCLLQPDRHYNYNPIGTMPTCGYGKDHVYDPDR